MTARTCLCLALACATAAPAGCEPEVQAPQPRPPATRPQTQPTSAPAPPPPAFFAAVGYSRKADAVAAAEEAATEALAPCRAAGALPAGAIFLERLAGMKPADGDRIGRAIQRITGAPTFGHGGSGAALPTRGASSPGVAGLMVLVLAGKGVTVQGRALSGPIEHDDADDPAKAARCGKLRDACTERGRALGGRLASLDKPGFVLALGALEGDWAAMFFTGLHARLGAGVPIVGAAGGWESYVYAEGSRAGTGQLAVVVQGEIRVAVETVASRDRWDEQVALDEARQAASAVRQRLAPAPPALVLAFSSAGRRAGAQAERTAIEQVLGPGAPLFGCYSRGEAGTDAPGKLSAGTGRIVICGVAPGSSP